MKTGQGEREAPAPATFIQNLASDSIRAHRYLLNRSKMDPGEQIPKLTESIVRSFAPSRVILFGSHARGEAGANSDVDLLVVMTLCGKSRCQQAAAIYQQCHLGFPMDIVVRTPEEFEEGLHRRDWFLQEIAREGKVMYAA